MIFVKYKLQIAAVCDPAGIFKSFLMTGEKLAQLFLALEVKLLALEFHTVGIIHGFTGLNAQQDILHGGIFPPEIMGIVGDN